MQLASTLFYTLMVALRMVQLERKGLKFVVFGDKITCLLPALISKLIGLKIFFYEGNLPPWAIPYIISRRLSVPKNFLRSFEIIAGQVIGKLSDAVIVNDGLIKEGMISRGINERKLFLLRGAVNTSEFRPMKRKDISVDDEFVIGFIGRLSEEKGASFLLDICKISIVKLPKVRFVILGGGSLVHEFEVLPNVKQVGQVEQNMVSELLSSIDAVVSFQKTFGRGEVEAFSCGKPIIASKIGEMPRLILDRQTGLLCKPNAGSYIEAISTLLNNKILLEKLSQNSRLQAINCYDWQIREGEWKSIINKIMKESTFHD
jgi:glycosyltransferase involved in cell wall biosynthesis